MNHFLVIGQYEPWHILPDIKWYLLDSLCQEIGFVSICSSLRVIVVLCVLNRYNRAGQFVVCLLNPQPFVYPDETNVYPARRIL